METSILNGSQSSESPYSPSHDTSEWLACTVCEAPFRDREIPKGSELRCTRCGTRLRTTLGIKTLQPAFAFSTAGLLAIILSNAEPVLSFSVMGNTQSGRMITGVMELFNQGYWPLALLVLFAGILAPAIHLSSIWYVSLACCIRRRLPMMREFLECIGFIEPWNLVPVYAVASIVAVVKLRLLGTVEWQFAARWVVGLSLCSLFADQFFDRKLARRRIKEMP